jgi:pimeloyl-ACP methyl ester carboxylesterase
VPSSFVRGLLDPVSGAHVIEEVARRLPDADITALPAVAHWPPLEAPDEVAAAIRRVAGRA